MVEPDQLNVVCDYTLTASGVGLSVRVMYLMVYEVAGNAPIESDVEQFAKVNAVYHSWPFLRQFLHDLTAKMGLPALTLPVFQVLSRTQADKTEKPPAKKVRGRRQEALSE
jgi:preprotein translocase subunit SecB